MILCSHFFWFCDVESDVPNRDLTPNHRLVGGSSTAHCATPIPVNLQKIQDERNESFSLSSTAQRAPALSSFAGVQPSCRAFPVHLTPRAALRTRLCPGAWPQSAEQGRGRSTAGHHNSDLPLSSGRAGLYLCAVQSKIKNTQHTPCTTVHLTEQYQEKRIHLTGLVFLNNPIKASREPLIEEFIFSTSRKDEISGMQMSKKKDSAQVSCHCLRKAPPHPVRQDSRDGFLQLSPLLHRWFLSAFWCYPCIILWHTWFSSGRFLDCLSCNTWPIFPLLQLVIMWAAHEWVPFYEVLRN